jgi:aspartyl-tRNA(Asn)/glutamyl-tRNA(Gln) amidotransferase subunit A
VNPYDLSLSEAARLIKAGELSPVELTESVLHRIEEVDDRIGAYASVTAEPALTAARVAEQEIGDGHYRGPLQGIPVALKDLYDTADVVSTSSSKVRAGYTPNADSAVGERLRAGGAVLVGKTHTHEFAYGVITPTTRNPWNPAHIPGGSSGGSAAAVAAGMCLLGMGSDTGGSIRIPSSLCGTVGLKPTYGRVSRRGVASLSWSCDHVGPLVRTVRDAAIVMDVISGFDRLDPATVDVPVPPHTEGLEDGVAGLTVGVPTGYFFDGLDPEVETAVRAAVGVFESAGAKVREVTIPLVELSTPVAFTLIAPEASAYHQPALREKAGLYGEDVRALLEAGELILATDYVRALQARTLLQRGWQQAFEDVDVVLGPSTPQPAPAVGQQEFPGGEPVLAALIRLATPGNVSGLPALSVPCGFTGAGLPIGLQILGRPFAEPMVLRVGRAYEAATHWTSRRPELGG